MNVLIIGGSEFIGRHVARLASAEGHDITLFNRGKSNPTPDFALIKGDVENISDHKDEIRVREFDVVVHCISYGEKHAADTVSLFKGTNTHIISLSSCDCYEAFQGLNRRVDKSELPITESSELSKMKYYWSDSKAKGDRFATYDKNLMTDVLMEAHGRGEIMPTVFRLPMVYGPHDRQYPGRHGAFIRRILDKRKKLVLSDREQSAVFTFGYVENVAAAIVHAFGKQELVGKVYNLGENKSRSRRRWAELYAQVTGWEFEVHILPEELLRKDKDFRGAPPQHLLTLADQYKIDSGFQNPIELEEAVQRTFSYAAEHPEVLGDRVDYDAEERLIQKYYSGLEAIHQELEV